MEELVQKLKKHDWYFGYSDDAKAYRRGLAQREEIESLIKELGSKAAEAVKEHAPEEFVSGLLE